MGVFFISILMIIFSLYHIHICLTINKILKLHKISQLFAIVTLILLWSGIPLSRVVTKLDWLVTGQLLFRMGALWLGFVLLFFCFEFLLFFLEGVTRLWMRQGWDFRWQKNKRVLVLQVALALLANLYGFYEAGRFTTSRLMMTVPAIPPGATPIKIVHFSDAHYGHFMLRSRHEKLLQMMRDEKPDMIVDTGDFIDFGAGSLDAWINDWKTIQPPLGKWAVLGNHENMAGVKDSVRMLEGAGFRLLRNEMVSFDGFALLGVDDPSVTPTRDLVVVRWTAKPGESILLLHHQPLWPAPLAGRFDLGLAGHTHGGQIFPLGVLVTLNYGVLSGLRTTPWGGGYFISRGIGTWGPPIRIASPPEITVLTLTPGSERSIGWLKGGH